VQAQLPELDVRLAMRYGEPAIASTLRAADADGATRVLVLPLYPQYSASTTASVHDAVAAELAGWRRRPALSLLSDYHLDADWLQALAASVREHWQAQGRGERLLLSFHGLPAAQDAPAIPTPPVPRQRRRAGASCSACARTNGCSRSSRASAAPNGCSPTPTLTLAQLARERVRRVDVLCPGFAVDCLETLEEIAVENAAGFRAAGGEALRYIPALNAGEAHARALAALVRRELLAGTRHERAGNPPSTPAAARSVRCAPDASARRSCWPCTAGSTTPPASCRCCRTWRISRSWRSTCPATPAATIARPATTTCWWTGSTTCSMRSMRWSGSARGCSGIPWAARSRRWWRWRRRNASHAWR
jgi:hypothetical protein